MAQLADLIEIVNGELSRNDRKKLITLCTIDVHARDVVQRLIDERVENGAAFQWQSQLRYTQHDKTKECQVCSSNHLMYRSPNLDVNIAKKKLVIRKQFYLVFSSNISCTRIYLSNYFTPCRSTYVMPTFPTITNTSATVVVCVSHL